MSWTQDAKRSISGAFRAAVDDLLPHIQKQALSHAAYQGWRLDKPQDYCGRCGQTVGFEATTAQGCYACLNQTLAWSRLVRLAEYRPPMDQWIVSMKFGKQWQWSQRFGKWLGRRIEQSEHPTVVCSVPMHWARRWRRGYNQAELIAHSLAQVHGWPAERLLFRTRYTQPQTRVAYAARPRNVRQSFRMAPVDLAGWRVVLVDDVKTSGATLSACAKLLRKAGAQSVTVAVVAVADQHRHRH